MTKFNRVITIVVDSLGIGQAADSAQFNDVGADTLGHIAALWAQTGGCRTYKVWVSVIFVKMTKWWD